MIFLNFQLLEEDQADFWESRTTCADVDDEKKADIDIEADDVEEEQEASPIEYQTKRGKDRAQRSSNI